MENHEEIKNIVKEKYSSIANSKQSGCCSTSSCGCSADDSLVSIGESYNSQPGYVKDADLGLGCGIPTDFANIKDGETVVDLGSGAGNDVFVARSFTGPTGFVIGVDMTESMINKANENLGKTSFQNIEFRLGEIENIPVTDSSTDLVLSNCVLNLVPDKIKAFSEIYRITKPGGRFCISDIVMEGELPEKIRKSADFYVGCIAGAMNKSDYLAAIEKAGFKNIEIKKSRQIELPDYSLEAMGILEETREFKKSGGGIYSITVTGIKS